LLTAETPRSIENDSCECLHRFRLSILLSDLGVSAVNSLFRISTVSARTC
jgi:hypothetical protein